MSKPNVAYTPHPAAPQITSHRVMGGRYALGLLESADPVGPENDRHIREAAMAASVVILAHGTSSNARLRERIRSRAWTVRAILRECGRDPRCLGVTADHQPKHPVRLPGNLTPQAWRFP